MNICVCMCVCLEESEIKNRMTLYDIVNQCHPFICVILKFHFNAYFYFKGKFENDYQEKIYQEKIQKYPVNHM